MANDKQKLVFVITVFLAVILFSNGTYQNFGEPGFYIPFMTVALAIGVIGVYVFGKDMLLHKNLFFISYVITAGLALVPVAGSYGFPAQWLHYSAISGAVSLNILSLIFNFFIFYFILRLFKKTLRSFTKHEPKWTDS